MKEPATVFLWSYRILSEAQNVHAVKQIAQCDTILNQHTDACHVTFGIHSWK